MTSGMVALLGRGLGGGDRLLGLDGELVHSHGGCPSTSNIVPGAAPGIHAAGPRSGHAKDGRKIRIEYPTCRRLRPRSRSISGRSSGSR